jgi:SulP family sulfate permease
MAAMAAVLMAVAVRMGEWHELMRLRNIPASDALVMICTFLLTVMFDLVIAIEVGMVLAALLFIRRVSEGTQVSQVTAQHLQEEDELTSPKQPLPQDVVVFQIFGPFLFGAVEKLEDAMSQLGEIPKVLILRMQVVTTLDATGLNALTSVVERLQAKGGTVILCGAQPIPLRMLTQSGLRSRIGERNLTGTYAEAVARAEILVRDPER